MSALQTTDASAQKIVDAKTFNKNIQGVRAIPLPSAGAAGGIPDPNTPAPTTISTSQQFAQRIGIQFK
jgi:hypothetical protein